MSDAQDSGAGTPAVQPVDAPPGVTPAGRTWERTAKAVAALQAARAARAQTQPAEGSEPAPEAEAAPAEAATPSLPESAKSPDLVELEAKVARALAGAQKYERESHEQRRARESLEAEVKAMREREAKLRGNPLELLKEYGVDYAQLTKDILAGKFQPPNVEEIERKKQLAQYDELKKRVDSYEEERQALKRAETRTKEVEFAQKRIQEKAETLPVLSALGWTPSKAVDQFYAIAEKQGSAPDFDALLSELESAASADVRSVLSNERAIKALISSDKAIRDTVVKALGLTTKQNPASPASETRAPSAGNGPRTITNDDAASPASRERRAASDDERKRAAIARLAALRAQKSA